MGLNLSRMPESRSRCEGWMKVRVMYRDLIIPSSKWIPVSSAKPIAAGVPESGRVITTSASTGASRASSRPIWRRAS